MRKKLSKKTYIIIFAAIVVVFIFFWYWKQNMFSSQLLNLNISGPATATVGNEITYTVKYKNNANFVLQKPQLVFEMPDNSLTEDGKTLIIQSLKDIYPGDEEQVQIKTRLLGKEGDTKIAKASITYTPQNLTAIYESDATFSTKIDTVPITLDFDLPTKVENGKSLQYSINYFSNVDYPLENLSIKVDQISGFNFVSALPKSLDNVEWKLATLNKTQGGRITINGNVNASAGSKITFSAELGMWQNGNFVVIKQSTQDVNIIQSQLSISQQINRASNYVASAGDTLNYNISFTNVGSDPFNNLSATVKLNGAAFDLSTIRAQGGQIQNNNTIVFDYNSVPAFRNLFSQQTAQINFAVKLKNNWTPSSTGQNNSTISDDVNAADVTQSFSTKINAGLGISQAGYYKDSDIPNSGPIPPKAGSATTYTIVWNVKNYSGDENDVKAKATLPQNVSLTGNILPSDQSSNFSFDSASREIVWSAGDISAGTGVTGDPDTLSFQISLTPTSDQKGSKVQLIGPVQISGENQFTNTNTTSQDLGIDTSLPDDSANSGGGVVQ